MADDANPSDAQAANSPNSARLLTVSEVAHLLNIHPNTVRRWNDQGLLKAYRIGSRRDRRFRWGDIQHFLEAASEPEQEVDAA